MQLEQLKLWLSSVQERVPAGLFDFVLNALGAIAILILGWIVSRMAKRAIRNSRLGTLDDGTPSTARPVIASVVGYAILIAALYAALRHIGIEAASLLALLGGAALAIGLALQGTLSNIAAGLYLLILRPLKAGEFVETPNFMGTVVEIGLFSSIIKVVDGTFLYVPNNQISSNRIQNFNRHQTRKLIMNVGVGYDTDLRAAQKTLLDAMSGHADVLSNPTPPEAYVTEFADSSINLSLRCWLPGDNWLARASDMRMHIKDALDANNIEIPFPQRVITTKAG